MKQLNIINFEVFREREGDHFLGKGDRIKPEYLDVVKVTFRLKRGWFRRKKTWTIIAFRYGGPPNHWHGVQTGLDLPDVAQNLINQEMVAYQVRKKAGLI